jgi:hypothetical protein
LDAEVERFRGRRLEGSYPYVWLDTSYLKARQDGQVVSVAIVIAMGVNAKSGERPRERLSLCAAGSLGRGWQASHPACGSRPSRPALYVLDSNINAGPEVPRASRLSTTLRRGSGLRGFEREKRNRRERAQHEREQDTEQPSLPGSPVRRVARPALRFGLPPG